MKAFLIAVIALAFCAPGLAQSADEPASRDDVILYLRTMHSHDLMRKTMEVQFQSMMRLMHEQVLKEKGKVPADYETRMKKVMDDLVQNVPADEITQAMIPAYQKHFTKSDIAAMNAFYSSPVGQKVLQELPSVMKEGMDSALPIMSKYLSEWKERMQKEFDELEKSSPKSEAAPAEKN